MTAQALTALREIEGLIRAAAPSLTDVYAFIPSEAVYPYATLMPVVTTTHRAQGGWFAQRHRFQIDVWSRPGGGNPRPIEIYNLTENIRSGLDDAALTMNGGGVLAMRSMRVTQQTPGTWRGMLEFTLMTNGEN